MTDKNTWVEYRNKKSALQMLEMTLSYYPCHPSPKPHTMWSRERSPPHGERRVRGAINLPLDCSTRPTPVNSSTNSSSIFPDSRPASKLGSRPAPVLGHSMWSGSKPAPKDPVSRANTCQAGPVALITRV